MKGLMLLADHFEDIEALATTDLLKRAKIDIELVSMTKSRTVTSQYGLKIQVRKLINEINLDDFDFLVIPGGRAVSEFHLTNEETMKVVEHFAKKEQLIAAICAAPSILGKMGLLKEKKYTCFPTYEKEVIGGKYLPKKSVVQDGNFITARAAGSSFEFSYYIITFWKGKEVAKQIKAGIYE